MGSLITKPTFTPIRQTASNFFNISTKNIDNQTLYFQSFKSRTIILLSSARCEPQENGAIKIDGIADLLQIYDKYQEKGLEIIMLPIRAASDSISDANIKSEARNKYKITFPLLKSATPENIATNPVFAYVVSTPLMKSQKSNLINAKFFINKKGEIFNYLQENSSMSQIQAIIDEQLGK